MTRKLLYSLLIALCSITLSGLSQAQSEIPIEDFFKDDAFGEPKISPTGEYIAATIDLGSRRDLIILRRSDFQKVNYVKVNDGGFVSNVYWANW
jgi:hypothetical protein